LTTLARGPRTGRRSRSTTPSTRRPDLAGAAEVRRHDPAPGMSPRPAAALRRVLLRGVRRRRRRRPTGPERSAGQVPRGSHVGDIEVDSPVVPARSAARPSSGRRAAPPAD
jgi:hypothetical protein